MTGFGQSRIPQRGRHVRGQHRTPLDRPGRAHPRLPRSGRSRPRRARPALRSRGRGRGDRRSLSRRRCSARGRGSVDRAFSFAGRLRVRRTPQASRSGGGPARSGSGIVGTLQHDQGIDRDGTGRGRDDRVSSRTSMMSGRSIPSRPSATSMATTADRSIAPRPRTTRSRRAPRSSSSIASAAAASSGASRMATVVEDLGQDATQPHQHRGTALWVATQPEDQLHARRGIGFHQKPADGQPVAPTRLEQRQRRPVDRVVATQTQRQPADLALVREPNGVELDRHRMTDLARGRDRGRGIGHGGHLGEPGSRRPRPAPGFRARTARRPDDSADASAAGPPRTTSDRMPGRASPGRHGPAAERRSWRPSLARQLGDRPERRDGHRAGAGRPDRRRRAAPWSRVAARPRSTRRRPAGWPPVRPWPPGSARVTSLAVATSEGSERYGKSWTRTSTS